MINPNELRIGNYLFHNNQITKIWSEEICDIENKSTDSEFFNPIPLSPEILEACGFEKKLNSNQYSLQGFLFDIQQMDARAYEVQLNDEFVANNFGYQITVIFYLHQLQNLYYSTSGSELMIDYQKLQRSVATTAK